MKKQTAGMWVSRIAASLVAVLVVMTVVASCSRPKSGESQKAKPGKDMNYLVGRAVRDITGPAMGVQMFGFVRADQITEGIHIRLRSRAFIVADPKSGKRVAYVVADLGSVTHEIFADVVDRVQKKLGPELYTRENVVVSATHTHCGPGGYWHNGANTPIGGPFYQQHFDAIADGIAESILAAHADLKPGKILINKGRVEGGGVNRSAVAYELNPPEERARYQDNVDKDMTLLKFVREDGEVAQLNWFAVHPTSMTFFNKLITGDHKGYAAMIFEKSKGAKYENGNDFVAGFAQTNCGDVTPNLNLDGTGPGKDEFETTKIIANRQLERAVQLYDTATETLEGPIDYRHAYIDMSGILVADEFTHEGPQTTCASAFGYSFGAGSSEDGGGHPMLKEGMTQRSAAVDNIINGMGNVPVPSDALRKCHAPKPILFPTGEMKPTGHPQVVSIGLVRIGSLVLVVGPAEYTTMSGRRIREAVAMTLGDSCKHVVMAGYANGVLGYVTTKQEYQSQQYEGGHTLYGPWTQAAYAQEFCRLAKAMASGQPAASEATPVELRGEVKSTDLGTPFDLPAPGKNFGDAQKQPNASYKKGETVEAAFWTGHPQNDFHRDGNFLSVERKEGEKWVTVATDNDWETKCRWKQPNGPPPPNPYGLTPMNLRNAKPTTPEIFVTLLWDIPAQTTPGTYRLSFHGAYKEKETGAVKKIEASSSAFEIVGN